LDLPASHDENYFPEFHCCEAPEKLWECAVAKRDKIKQIE
jgi:hypothetical protein